MTDNFLDEFLDEDEGFPGYTPEVGTPQGGVLSPLLANIYLHEVLDVWFEDVVTPRLKGPAFLIRYADDVIIVCGREDDARHVARKMERGRESLFGKAAFLGLRFRGNACWRARELRFFG